jgi:hypothetical protein
MSRLVKCKDCGRMVSKKATKCPQCGAPRKRTSLLTKIIGGFFALVLVIGIIGSQSESPSTSADQQANSPPDVDCSTNGDREAFIAKLIAQGYWQKVERPGSLLRVYVMPRFVNEATHDDKQQFISVASAYEICSGGDGSVSVYDAMTDKTIGSFSTEFGLIWD